MDKKDEKIKELTDEIFRLTNFIKKMEKNQKELNMLWREDVLKLQAKLKKFQKNDE